MNRSDLFRQVSGSTLVDSVGKLSQIEGLLDAPCGSLKLKAEFSSRSHGWSPQAFHSRCDNKGPTLTLVQRSDGHCYGGYTSRSWNSATQRAEDSSSFLFRFPPESDNPTQQAAEKFPFRVESQLSSSLAVSTGILSDLNYGPIFGARHDLVAFGGSHMLICNHSHSYQTGGPLIDDSIPKHASNFEIEVLLVGSLLPQTSSPPQGLGCPRASANAWSEEVSIQVPSHLCCQWQPADLGRIHCQLVH